MKKAVFLLSMLVMVAPYMVSAQKKSTKTTKAVPQQAEETKQPDPVSQSVIDQQRIHHPMHDKIMEWAGHWRDEMKFWRKKGEEPSSVIVERNCRPVAEGKFISGDINGQMGALPYEAHFIIGYDNIKNVFVKTWFDNTSSSIMYLEGSYEDQENRIVFTGMIMDPVSHAPVPIKQILYLKSPELQVLEIYISDKEGQEFKSMEITSRRS